MSPSTTSSTRIARGSQVTLHYTLSIAGDKVAETTRGGAPATIVIGGGELIPAFECRLIGLEAGDRQRFEIPCLEAYGPAEPDELHVLPRGDFPPDMKLEPGLLISFATPTGDEAAGVVAEVSANEVTVNFANPLAGHDLVFEVEILDVKPPQTQ
jgi:FKBP-type peptidyl-prolyl cis-trans isomerase SlpA